MGQGYRKSWNMMAALGLLPDAVKSSFVGYNPDIDINTSPETIWGPGGLFVPPTVAGTVSIVSDSANDDVAGTGALLMAVTGLDANYDEIVEVVVLTGTTPVVTSQSFLRVNRCAVLSSGSGQYNDGIITSTIGALTVCQILANESVSHIGKFTVPATKTFMIQNIISTLGKTQNGTAVFVIEVMFFGTNTWFVVNKFNLHSNASPFVLSFTDNPLIAPPKSIIRFNVQETDVNNISASVGITGLLFDSSNPL